jgi:hypothetical protein
MAPCTRASTRGRSVVRCGMDRSVRCQQMLNRKLGEGKKNTSTNNFRDFVFLEQRARFRGREEAHRNEGGRRQRQPAAGEIGRRVARGSPPGRGAAGRERSATAATRCCVWRGEESLRLSCLRPSPVFQGKSQPASRRRDAHGTSRDENETTGLVRLANWRVVLCVGSSPSPTASPTLRLLAKYQRLASRVLSPLLPSC